MAQPRLPAGVPQCPARATIRLTTPVVHVPAARPTRVGRFHLAHELTRTHQLLLAELDAFFTDARLIRVRDAVQRRRKDAPGETVSLRVLDWLVTNYSKAHLIQCTGPDGFPRDLHNAYRETLGFYSRPLFDPFSRGERTRVTYELEGETLNSSIAQLNFMGYLLRSHDMLQYAITNAPAIEADMAAAQARARDLRAAGGSKKRRVELTAYNPTRVHIMRLPAHAAAEPAEEAEEAV
jgi:hypothetical protein